MTWAIGLGLTGGMTALQQLLQNRGLSVRKLAGLTNIPYASLHDYVSGRTALPDRVQRVVLDTLNCSAAELPAKLPARPRFELTRARTRSHELQVDQGSTWASFRDVYPDLLKSLVVPELPLWFTTGTHTDSKLEVAAWSQCLAREGQPTALSPVLYGFERQPLVTPCGKALGVRRKTCISFSLNSLRVLLWPQVTMRTSAAGDIRVDALVLARIGRRRLWFVVEIDGPVHSDPSFHRRRDASLKVPVLRFRQHEVLSGCFAAVLEQRARALFGD